ncbi:uncharacterized protein LOC135427899 [Drosophila montana]|uniref:uncharacterized protein LOC135427899 n=1 Tax=Drosophila montana TaxID=40370 RepID=UPI00313C6598
MPVQEGQQQQEQQQQQLNIQLGVPIGTSTIETKATCSTPAKMPTDAQAQLAHYKRLIAQLESDQVNETTSQKLNNYNPNHSSSELFVDIEGSDGISSTMDAAQQLLMTASLHPVPTTAATATTIDPPNKIICISSDSSSTGNTSSNGCLDSNIATTSTTGAMHYKLLHQSGKNAKTIRRKNTRKINRQTSSTSRSIQQDASRSKQIANRNTQSIHHNHLQQQQQQLQQQQHHQ